MQENIESRSQRSSHRLDFELAASQSTQEVSQPTASITEDSRKLCERCRKLDIFAGFDPPERKMTSYGTHVITPDSIDNECYICTQLKAFFRGHRNAKPRRKRGPPRPEVKFDTISILLMPGPPYFYIDRDNARRLSFYPMDTTSAQTNIVEDGRYGSLVRWRMLNTEAVDFKAVNDWVAHCRINHASSCGSLSQQSVRPLRLIDCNTRQLAYAPPDCPYVALSYLWGTKVFEEQGDQDNLPIVVPRVIEDAMAVAIALGTPYLWVDRYCIRQSNSEEKHRLINSMDTIYGGAQITIIASAGSDPDYGLPGISGPRATQHTFQIGSHVFVSVGIPGYEIKDSVWWTRGWTYQEMLLSRRRLVFTESQIYFQCLEMHCLEALSMKFPSKEEISWLSCFPDRGIGTTSEALYSRLKEYYKKQLSYQTDILNGFAGVFNAFRNAFPTPVNHFWGIPFFSNERKDGCLENASFARGLFWKVRFCGPRRSRQDDSEKIWPTWSWATFKAGCPVENPGILDMNDVWLNEHLSFQDDIDIHITHHSNRSLDLVQFAAHADDHSKFFSWIDIATWTITSHVVFNQRTSAQKILHAEKEVFEFDEKESNVYSIFEGVERIVVYLGTFCQQASYNPEPMGTLITAVWLIVEEQGPGLYRRVGTGSINHWVNKDIKAGAGVGPPLSWIPDSKLKHVEDKWQKRTLRLV